MPLKIFKYNLDPNRDAIAKIELPKDARILSLQLQNRDPRVWCIVDTEAPSVERFFKFLTTGATLGYGEGNGYIGTFQLDAYVWHVFEVFPIVIADSDQH